MKRSPLSTPSPCSPLARPVAPGVVALGATFAVVAILAAAPVEAAEACEDDADCPVGSLCISGVCNDTVHCTTIWRPVCGEDGRTYANGCRARLAHAEVAHEGPCTCGGIAGETCAEGLFCEYETGQCRVPDAVGVCAERPEVCPRHVDPVCGCDGKTYSNDCVRRSKGVAELHDGECRESTARTATYAGLCQRLEDCDRNESCQFPDGACENEVSPGHCVERPVACPDIWDPECGCDVQTYGNRCERLAAGVSLLHEGECAERCGGFAGGICPPGKVCDPRPGACRGADIEGECKPAPEVCPEHVDPVCGCDGRTYGNDCKRFRAGVAKDHDGHCLVAQ